MTNDDVRRAERRIADARLARRAELDAAARPPGGSEASGAAPFRVGDRVLDTRSGREGTVDNVRPTDRDGLAWIWVRFVDGDRGALRAADLISRPRPPAGRS